MLEIKDRARKHLAATLDAYFRWRLRLYHGEVGVEKENFVKQILSYLKRQICEACLEGSEMPDCPLEKSCKIIKVLE